MLTAARARKILAYDKQTGVFRWRIARPRRPVGSIAGAINARGSRLIWIDGQAHYASRLAFLIIDGEWPPEFVDHRNHNRADDRWSNLRKASRTENNRNRRCQRSSSTGLKGVFPSRSGRRFRAAITVDGKRKWLGYFKTPLEASAAYRRAALEHHGEFACAKGRT